MGCGSGATMIDNSQRRPIWIGLPRELIVVGRNVTGTTRVSILVPGASDIWILLVDREVHITHVQVDLASKV